MSIKEPVQYHRYSHRREWSLIILLLLLAVVSMFSAGQYALRMLPAWRVSADMSSLIDPDGTIAAYSGGSQIEPVGQQILTPYSFDYLTPASSNAAIYLTQVSSNATITETIRTLTPAKTATTAPSQTATDSPTVTLLADQNQDCDLLHTVFYATRCPSFYLYGDSHVHPDIHAHRHSLGHSNSHPDNYVYSHPNLDAYFDTIPLRRPTPRRTRPPRALPSHRLKHPRPPRLLHPVKHPRLPRLLRPAKHPRPPRLLHPSIRRHAHRQLHLQTVQPITPEI